MENKLILNKMRNFYYLSKVICGKLYHIRNMKKKHFNKILIYKKLFYIIIYISKYT